MITAGIIGTAIAKTVNKYIIKDNIWYQVGYIRL
jgi:hypothetical protein